jgi:hypothetical protein
VNAPIARGRPHPALATLWLLGTMTSWALAEGLPAPLPPPPPHAFGAAGPQQATVADTSDDPNTPAAAADPRDGRCDQCGGCAGVLKVCVPKPKEREIKKTCWSYKCEDFCIPGPSEYCGRKCGKDECGSWSYDIWKATCAAVRTKKVPVKTEVIRKVPGVEWKPEERCASCRGQGRGERSCAATVAP